MSSDRITDSDVRRLAGIDGDELRFEQSLAQRERERIRAELIDWLVGYLDPRDAGLVNGRRIMDEIDRICPKE